MNSIFYRTFVVLLLILFLSKTTHAQHDSLRVKFQTIIRSVKADVGVAVLGLEDRDTLSFNGQRHYPMQSVYKLHLAMAILDQVDKRKLSLDQKIKITKVDLLPDTHSPLRDKYPDGAVMPLSEVLKYTVSQSDNNGCDILFRLVGGTKKVEDYIYGLGVNGISIKATEEEMHKEWNVQFTNWSTPLAVVQLLDIFYQQKNLSKTSTEFLRKILIETATGPKRIKGRLPSGTIAAHKTGFSGTNESGVTAATNDVGIVTLPNGKHFAIAVFVSNATESVENLDGVIAGLSKATWDYFCTKK